MRRDARGALGVSAAAIALGVALLVGVQLARIPRYYAPTGRRPAFTASRPARSSSFHGLKKPVRVTVFMDRDSPLWTPVSELLSRYRALSQRSRSSSSTPGAIPRGPRRQRRSSGGDPPGHGGFPFRRPQEVRRRRQDGRVRVHRRPVGRAAPRDEGVQGGGSVHFGDPSRRGGPSSPRLLRLSGHGEGSIDAGERGRGFADAKQLLERDNLTVATWESLGKDAVRSRRERALRRRSSHGAARAGNRAIAKYLAAGGEYFSSSIPFCPCRERPASDFGSERYSPTTGSGSAPTSSWTRQTPSRSSVPGPSLPTGTAATRSCGPRSRGPSGHPRARAVRVERRERCLGHDPGRDFRRRLGRDGALRPRERAEERSGGRAGPGEPRGGRRPRGEREDSREERQTRGRRELPLRRRGLSRHRRQRQPFPELNPLVDRGGAEKRIGIAPKTRAGLPSLNQAQSVGSPSSILGMPAMAILLGIWVWYRRRDERPVSSRISF